jgi:hypothetical protein
MFNKEDAEKFWKFLNHKKFTEVRIIAHQKVIEDTFVDNLADFLATCEKYSGKGNVYVGVNERAVKEGKAEYVSTLQIIPIDIDPVRPKGEASTDAELEIARQKMLQIKNWLKEEFDCFPFATMSGNGYHLFIKIPAVPLDDFNRDTIQAKVEVFTHEIQDRFNDEKVHIDSTFDLPRIMKCPGTMTVKGDNTPERPWRMCKIIEANDVACIRMRDHLAQIELKKTTGENGPEFGTKTKEDFDTLLHKDEKLKDLLEGKWEKRGFPSRSEAEQSLLTKLVFYGFSEDAILEIMNQNKIGKWQEKSDAYRSTSIKKAIEFVKEHKHPYESEREKEKRSCGEDLPNKVFEQIDNQQFLVYDKTLGTTTKVKNVDGFKPIEDLLWKPVNDIDTYESEEELWNEVRHYIWGSIDLQEGYDVLTGWVLASWIPEKWHAIPYLFFHGPPGAGKTWALQVLESIGFRAFLTPSITVASLFRVCDHYKPTLFLDETETYMMKDRREIMNLLNSGYREGSKAVRTEDTKDGYKIRTFKTFGFKALSGTKELIDTLRSRCIIFSMSEATREIKTVIDQEKAEKLRKNLLAYRFKMLSRKEKLETPELLKALKGRLRELFEPLISVAPPSAKQSITAEAARIEQTIQEEQRASPEAVVFRAIVKAYEEKPEENKVSIKRISDVLNEGLPMEEWKNTVTVGIICSRLGFKRTMKGRERAIFWNQQLAERHARKYYPEWITGQQVIPTGLRTPVNAETT